MNSSHTTSKRLGPQEASWATWMILIGWVWLSSQWNGLSAYGYVWWETGLMVPLDGNGCPRCKIACMGGLPIGFGPDGWSSELPELANRWVDEPEMAQRPGDGSW